MWRRLRLVMPVRRFEPVYVVADDLLALQEATAWSASGDLHLLLLVVLDGLLQADLIRQLRNPDILSAEGVTAVQIKTLLMMYLILAGECPAFAFAGFSRSISSCWTFFK